MMFTVKDFIDEMTELRNRAVHEAYESKEVEDLLEELATLYELAKDLFWLDDKEGLNNIKWYYFECYHIMEREYHACVEHEEELERIINMFID